MPGPLEQSTLPSTHVRLDRDWGRSCLAYTVPNKTESPPSRQSGTQTESVQEGACGFVHHRGHALRVLGPASTTARCASGHHVQRRQLYSWVHQGGLDICIALSPTRGAPRDSIYHDVCTRQRLDVSRTFGMLVLFSTTTSPHILKRMWCVLYVA